MLLIDDGADESTAFVDLSSAGVDSPHTLTAGGSAKHDDATKAFSGDTSSLFIPGTNSQIACTDSDDYDLLGIGTEWGMDAWFKTTTGGWIIAKYSSASQRAFLFEIQASTGFARFEHFHDRGVNNPVIDTGDIDLRDDTWHHMLMTHREDVPGNKWENYLFIDGVRIDVPGENTGTLQIDTTTSQVRIGLDDNNNGDWTGSIAWPRIWKGWLGPIVDFLPPTEAPPLS